MDGEVARKGADPKTQSGATVERLAVQRRARRTNGSSMLLRFPCGGIVRCNGLLGSGATTLLRTIPPRIPFG